MNPTQHSFDRVLARLKRLGRPEVVSVKERRFGIIARDALGIYQKDLKAMAREIGYDNTLAVRLFDTGVHEARLLCSKIYDPRHLTGARMERWAKSFDNWEVCDSFCIGLFSRSRFAVPKALKWSASDAELVKRAGFAIMASYAVANKEAGDEIYRQFFPALLREAEDDRKHVRKAVSWALRQIGKRNARLRVEAIRTARRISRLSSGSARWIAREALRELQDPDLRLLSYPRKKPA